MAAPSDATYITKLPSTDLTREFALATLATGLLKVTTSTGELSSVSSPSGSIVGTSDTQTLSNKTIIQTVASYSPSAGGTATLDFSTANIHVITMPAGNITIATSNVTANQCVLIEIIQDSGGSRTVTWFSGISWSGGSAPTLTTTANKRDVIGVRALTATTYYGGVVFDNI